MKREDQIQNILTYLTFAEDWILELPEDNPGGDYIPAEQLKYIMLPLSYFNGAELSMYDESLECKSYETWILNPFHKDNTELLSMDLGLWQSCALMNPGPDAPKQEKATALYLINKHRKIPLAEVRGKFKLTTGDLVEWASAYIYNNGTFQTNRAIYERRSDKWWCIGQPHAVKHPEPEDEEHGSVIFLAKALAFTRYYDWHVELGFQMPGRTMLPTVSLATDAAGAKTAYRLRDIPAGKSRREALRHWVNTHWRKNAYNPDEEIKIWAHLRGVEEFSHNGLKCRIIPSGYDLKKAAEYQRKAKETRERQKVS